MSLDPVQTIHDTYVSRYKNGAQTRSNGAVYRSDRISLASGGKPYPLANMGFIFEPPSSDSLKEAVRWIEEQEVPFWVNVTADALPAVEEVADDIGLVPIEMVLTGMLRPTLEEVPSVETAAEISPVTSRGDLEGYISVFDEVFDIHREGGSPDGSEESTVDTRTHAYLGRVDGTPVACGGTYRVGEVANLFGMAVVEGHRERGIGTAICSQALRAAREAGCELATLESSPMAESLYESLGFETHVKYHLFELEN